MSGTSDLVQKEFLTRGKFLSTLQAVRMVWVSVLMGEHFCLCLEKERAAFKAAGHLELHWVGVVHC